jgi:ankyrin repeat protein/tetratricopeptide (TPR) repeat protein
MSPRVMRVLILCLCCCFFLPACDDMRSARPPSLQKGSDAANEIPPIKGLIEAPDTPVGKRLKALQTEALPAALDGNVIAINICRQTMLGLGELTALEEMTFDLARPHPQEALDEWAQRLLDDAKNDDAIARTIIGGLHYTGKGAPHNPQRALELWRDAAWRLKYHDALCKLGNLHRSGEIVEKNISEAIEYYTRAGTLGSSNALYCLGAIFFHGEGVTKDQERAILYYQMAAGMGHTKAQVDLGLCYENGRSVPKNLDEAVRWYRAAARSGEFLGNVHLVRLGYPAVQWPPSEKGKPNDLEDTPVPTDEIYGINSTHLKGIYRSIRICDLKTIDDEIKTNPNILLEKDENGWTPLTLAVITGCKKTVAYLLDKGVDIDQPYHANNVTALHMAILTDRPNIVALLVEKGADMNIVCNPPRMHWSSRMVGTSLHTALRQNRWDILQFLLQNGADYTKPDLDGQTLFEAAVASNRRDEATKIYEAVGLPVPQVDPTVDTLLNAMGACKVTSTAEKGRAKVQELLQTHPELIHQADQDGSTPLNIACWREMEDLVRQLVRMGANVNARGYNGDTPLHKTTDNRKIARLLIENGARVNARNDDGQTPLHCVAASPKSEGNLETAVLLLKGGAVKQVRDKLGRTPLDLAKARGKVEMIRLLRGIDS